MLVGQKRGVWAFGQLYRARRWMGKESACRVVVQHGDILHCYMFRRKIPNKGCLF